MNKLQHLCTIFALLLMLTFAFTAHVSAQALPGSLWYNGDFNGVNALSNENNTSLGNGQFASVYEDFNVTGSGWVITSVYSNNLLNTVVTGADWEIRSGVSAGNGGTLVASGTTSSPVVAPTGRAGFGDTESSVEVTGLNVTLAPGTYWLNVTPVGDGTGRSFMSDTSGTNSVGTPGGNDMNAFFNSNFFSANFAPTDTQGQPGDFSGGVIGTSVSAGVPDSGSTFGLLFLSLVGLFGATRFRSRQLA